MADPRLLPGLKHIFTFPEGEDIVSMVLFHGKVLIATSRGLYSAEYDTITELRIQFDGQAPVAARATECPDSKSGWHTTRWEPSLGKHLCIHCGSEYPAAKNPAD